VIARLFAPFGALAFWQFLLLWDALLVGTAIWLGLGSLRSVLAIFAFPAVALELYHGNVHLLIAAAIWLGFRYPAAWSFVLLTKVTPGVGLVWFAIRREWRSLAIALGVTAALVAVSLVIDGRLWESWLRDSLEARPRVAARPVLPARPALDPRSGGPGARRVGRPHGPSLDRAGGGDARAPGPLAKRLRGPCGALADLARAPSCRQVGSGTCASSPNGDRTQARITTDANPSTS
jgi:hypothetical protein